MLRQPPFVRASATDVIANMLYTHQHSGIGTMQFGAGLQGLNDRTQDAVAALLGIYQTYQASVNQGRADDVYIDYLRDQVIRALYAIRQRIKQGDISPTQALQAGQGVISDFYRETGAMPRTQARTRAESYRAVFTNNAQLNATEAALYYLKYFCPEGTHTTDPCNQGPAGCAIAAADLSGCTPLSAAGTPTDPGTGAQSPAAPGAGNGAGSAGSPGSVPSAAGSIFDLLGTISLGGLSIPVLPLVAIGVILFFSSKQ